MPIAGYYSFDAIAGTPAQDGDVNMDEQVNILDVVSVVNFVLGLDNFTSYQQQIADMNNDNIVNILDIILIVNTILGN